MSAPLHGRAKRMVRFAFLYRLYLRTRLGFAVKFYEISVADRASLVEIVQHMCGRYFHPISECALQLAFATSTLNIFAEESKFSLSKKLKPERSNQAIHMDF